MSAHYAPGHALVLVGDHGLVATDRANAAGLISLAGRDLTVLGVIEALSAGSLATLGDFACVLPEGPDLRIVLRGRFTATVAESSWSGRGVATWIEQSVVGGAGATVELRHDDGAQAQGPEMPLASGVVLASHLVWTGAVDAAPGTGPDPAQEVVEVHEPADEAHHVADVDVADERDAETSESAEAPENAAAPENAESTDTLDEPAELLVAEAAQEEPQEEPQAGPAVPVVNEHTIAEPDLDLAQQAAAGLADPVRAPEPAPAAPVAEDRPVLPAPPVPVPSRMEVNVRPSPPDPEPDTAALPLLTSPPGDHDGRTITAAQLNALRGARHQLAVQAAVVLPDGTRYPVTPRVLLGRRPEARQITTGVIPRLVTVSGPYVSSTHLDVVLDGTRVMVTDVSTNGTLVVVPGQAPRALVKHQPTEVISGTVLVLSDDYQVTIDLAAGG